MLIRFRTSNFLSFNQEQELSMIAGSTKKKENHIIKDNKLKLLKFSAIYGANASGKSNLLKAMNLSKNIIIAGIKSNLANLYCRIKNDNENKISSFEYEIKLNNRFYAYGFDVMLSENSIKSEWLYELDKNKNKEVPIFTREINQDIQINNEYFDNNKGILNRLEVYHSDMKSQDTVLFLTVMNENKENLYRENQRNNIVIFKDIYNWFFNSFIFIRKI